MINQKISDIKVPFNDEGMGLHRYQYKHCNKEVDNHAKDYTFIIKSISHYMLLQDIDTGLNYVMLPSDIETLVLNATIHKATVQGKFCFVKRGIVYGIRYLGEVDDNYAINNTKN